ncbi:MAG: hypothetical protein JNK01_24405 [Devosia sp.]|nr:hypothetical protein [Devosia sp.]
MSADKDAFDNVIAMANVGMAFTQIWILEDLVAGLVTTSKVTLRRKLSAAALDAASLFLERHQSVRSSTFGRLVDAIEKSGVEGRDIRYLRAILELRNDFVHRLGHQVPLPGDWTRSGFSLEEFSGYTRYVIRHINTASRRFSRIMTRHGLLAGKFGDFGALLWNPDDPFLNGAENSGDAD